MMAPVAVALQRQLREAGAVCAETPRETVFQASSDCWYALQGSTSVRTAGAPCMEVLPFGLLLLLKCRTHWRRWIGGRTKRSQLATELRGAENGCLSAPCREST